MLKKKIEPKPVVEKKIEPKPVVEKKIEPKPVVEKKIEPKPVVEKKIEPKPVVEKKIEPKDTIISLDKVLEEDEWIVLEVKGKKNVYDISNWISTTSWWCEYSKGVEANKHYQNPKLYPDPPTEYI